MNFDNEDSINFIKNFSQENISDCSIINYFNKNEFIRKKFLNLKKIQKQKINEKIIFLKQFHKKNIKDSYENTYRKNYKSKSVSLNNQSTNNQSSSKNLSKILFTSNKYLIHSPSNSNINRHFLTLSPIKNKQLKKNHIKIHFDNNSFHKEKYGKLYLFKEQVKKIRHEKFIHNILENEFYFKKFENENKVQYFENLNYNYSKNLKLFNEFYENFNKYYKYLLINIERGKLKNIELNKKKN